MSDREDHLKISPIKPDYKMVKKMFLSKSIEKKTGQGLQILLSAVFTKDPFFSKTLLGNKLHCHKSLI